MLWIEVYAHAAKPEDIANGTFVLRSNLGLLPVAALWRILSEAATSLKCTAQHVT